MFVDGRQERSHTREGKQDLSGAHKLSTSAQIERDVAARGEQAPRCHRIALKSR